jgi:hypothetical protein
LRVVVAPAKLGMALVAATYDEQVGGEMTAESTNDNVSAQARHAAVRYLGWLESEGYANVRLRGGRSPLGDWAAIRKEGFMWGLHRRPDRPRGRARLLALSDL